MAQHYYSLVTTVGQAKIANAIALGRTIKLTHVGVSDWQGDPTQDQTELHNEVYRTSINATSVDPNNPNWMVVEAVIMQDVGGWYVREVGIFDEDGDMIAVSKYPETYKPLLSGGAGKDLYIKTVLEVSNSEAVELKVDPSIVLATREYVDRKNVHIPRPDFHLPLINDIHIREGVGTVLHSRASGAHQKSKSGRYTFKEANTPRIERTGFLNELDSTNIQLRAKSLDKASATRCVIEPHDDNGELGLPVFKYTASDASGYFYDGDISRTRKKGVDYCLSMYCKKGNFPEVAIRFHEQGFASTAGIIFNFDTKKFRVAGSASTIKDYGIIDEGKGWYRLWAVATCTEEEGRGCYFWPLDVREGFECYLAAWQEEEGVFPSSPILTDDTPLTRLRDHGLKITGVGNTTPINSPHTIALDFDYFGSRDDLFQFIYRRGEYPSREMIAIWNDSRLRAGTDAGSSLLPVVSVEPFKSYRIVLVRPAVADPDNPLNPGYRKVFINGELAYQGGSPDANDVYEDDLETMFIAGASSTWGMFGHIRNFKKWHFAFSDEQAMHLGASSD